MRSERPHQPRVPAELNRETRPRPGIGLSGAPIEKQAPTRLQTTPSLNGSTRTSPSPVLHRGARRVGLGHNILPDKNNITGGNLGRNREGNIHPLNAPDHTRLEEGRIVSSLNTHIMGNAKRTGSPIEIMQSAESRDFLHIVKEHMLMQSPQIVVLLETHVSGSTADEVCKKIGLIGQYRILHVYILEAREQFVTIVVSPEGYREWLFTAIYVNPHPSTREELRGELEQRASSYNHPWLLAGDFSKTRNLEERDHGGSNMVRHCDKFNNWIENNAPIDLGFLGPKYTWVHGLTQDTRKSTRLDRALCNIDWRLKFQEGGVKHLIHNQSNHAPILISTTGFSMTSRDYKPFRFEAAWLLHGEFDSYVRQCWDRKGTATEAL
ncbi:hypothetical protein Cgig2_009097 [Carnegiea gigantea]|uniref:Endonuclease/exonuclease/phosphatase domain-containing protein n=1 Tax=Carnegiea gigantea TaxID=171969 RepID=A0A9Q1QGW7_9CARY|nr:hypothetical protein Cgig2_009097 [Carnegiea gigantea]